MLTGYSGVWEVEEAQEHVIVNLISDTKTVIAAGQKFDVEVKDVDLNKVIIYMIAGTNKVSWRFTMVRSEDDSTFDLKWMIGDGSEYQMSYLGDLIQLK